MVWNRRPEDRWSLADPDIAEKIERNRVAPPRAPVVPIAPQLVRREFGPKHLSQEELEAAVVEMARRGDIAGVRLDFGLPEPEEQGFYYRQGLFKPAVRVSSRSTATAGENVFLVPKGAEAFVHTHPRWSPTAHRPGPKDSSVERPLFGIHEDGVWVLRKGESRPVSLWDTRAAKGTRR